MDLQELSELVERATDSAFRLETLPQYLVPQEADEFAAWRSGRAKPLATPETSPWLARLQATTARGFRWYRVHVLDLDQPLSDYSRFEVHGYRANQAAGEDIYLADRAVHPDLQQLQEDFWLIDDQVAIRVLYDDAGRFLRLEPDDDLAHYRDARDLALRHAESLDDFIARTRLRLTA